ncbi:MAG: arylsulfatase, partial [Thermomicrobiales bacterium]
ADRRPAGYPRPMIEPPTNQARAARPNVVFVLTDDQGYGDLGCHGNPYIRTPNIDQLHAQSVRLANYHVGPTCSPTRAGLMTGHFANSTGVWHTLGGRSLLRQGERTIADYLSEAGYITGLFGKWHLGDAYPYRPEDRGFQEVVTHGDGAVGTTPDYWGNNYTDDYYCHNGAWERFDGYCTDVWFRQGIDFIQRHRDRPFFCCVATNAPHTPHIVPERFTRPYRDLVAADPAAADVLNYPASDQMLKFYGMVSCIDHNVGVLRAKLDALGLTENTIFIFTTDNGSAGGLVRDGDQFVRHGFNAGMRGGKGSPYEGGHRVPFFLHWPGGELDRGRDVATLTANVDVAPTLLDLCGVAHEPAAFHGRSLLPVVQGEPAGDARAAWDDRAIVTDSQRVLHPVKWRLSCVMRGDWRLINGRALYDLARDPEQRDDVAAAHPDVVARMRNDYEGWWSLVSGRIGEEIPIVVGETAGTVLLTSHDWRRDPGEERVVAITGGDDARCVWNQAQVHQGPEENGYWEVDVAVPGVYRFELRRWPREADLPLTAGLPGEPKRYDDGIATGYGGGRAMPIRRAAIRAGQCAAEQDVAPTARAAIFELALEAGPIHVETALTTADGLSLGAYYVYVERPGETASPP